MKSIRFLNWNVTASKKSAVLKYIGYKSTTLRNPYFFHGQDATAD